MTIHCSADFSYYNKRFRSAHSHSPKVQGTSLSPRSFGDHKHITPYTTNTKVTPFWQLPNVSEVLTDLPLLHIDQELATSNLKKISLGDVKKNVM